MKTLGFKEEANRMPPFFCPKTAAITTKTTLLGYEARRTSTNEHCPLPQK